MVNADKELRVNVTLSFARSACSKLIPLPDGSFTLDWKSPEVSLERGLRAVAVGTTDNSRQAHKGVMLLMLGRDLPTSRNLRRVQLWPMSGSITPYACEHVAYINYAYHFKSKSSVNQKGTDEWSWSLIRTVLRKSTDH